MATMRAYASEQLTSSELPALRERHARHFAGIAEASWAGCRSARDREWSARLAGPTSWPSSTAPPCSSAPDDPSIGGSRAAARAELGMTRYEVLQGTGAITR